MGVGGITQGSWLEMVETVGLGIHPCKKAILCVHNAQHMKGQAYFVGPMALLPIDVYGPPAGLHAET